MEYIIIVLGFLLDRIAKIWAAGSLNEGKDITVIKNYFEFQYVENKGAAFGIMQNKQIILGIITLCLILGMVVYFIKYKPASKLLKVSLALVISGALGNLYDRFVHNYVVDYVSLHVRNIYYWPNFNIADILVVVGTCLLALYIIKDVKE